MTAPIPEYNENGYPTEQSLTAIETFVGTPEALIEYATALFDGGYVSVADVVDDFGRDVKQVTFITCGWSGAESVVGALSHRTFFQMRFWHSSYRGGKDVFEIQTEHWQTEGPLGRYDLPKANTDHPEGDPSATDQREGHHV